jgi:hypothetical protein
MSAGRRAGSGAEGAPMSDGEPLPHGNSNAVVRRGDRVHRVAGPWSPTVHAYLAHLRAGGVSIVPRAFGFDEEGREVLEHLPGTVPAYPLPPEVWSDGLLIEAAAWLRRIHDASVGFPLEGRVWQQAVRAPVEVVCVNDFAPYNFVLSGGRLTGIIDLDQAAPGPRARDVAYLAYRMVPLTAEGNPDAPGSGIEERARRARLLVATYGEVSLHEVLELVPPRLEELAYDSVLRSPGNPALAEHARLYRTDAAWVRRAAASLERGAGGRPGDAAHDEPPQAG